MGLYDVVEESEDCLSYKLGDISQCEFIAESNGIIAVCRSENRIDLL